MSIRNNVDGIMGANEQNEVGGIGEAKVHVGLAAFGLLVMLSLLAWTGYMNHFSDDGEACVKRHGRMTWSGCVGGKQDALPIRR